MHVRHICNLNSLTSSQSIFSENIIMISIIHILWLYMGVSGIFLSYVKSIFYGGIYISITKEYIAIGASSVINPSWLQFNVFLWSYKSINCSNETDLSFCTIYERIYLKSIHAYKYITELNAYKNRFLLLKQGVFIVSIFHQWYGISILLIAK